MKGMVNKVKLLPFEMNPHIRTYLNYAYAFGVIEGNLGGEIIPRLVCDSYSGCIFSSEDVNMFYIYSYGNDAWYEETGIMSHESYVCKDCDPKCVSEAIEIAKERILSGEYVYCRPNEGRFSVKNKGNPYNFDHECLLWGIDCDKETFQTSSYIEGNYVAYEISFDELYDALLNVQSGYVDLLFFKINRDFKFEPLKVDKVIFLLDEYLSSECSDFSGRLDIKEYIDSGKLKFGIAVWEELANYIEEIGRNGRYLDLDMRYVRSFMDHKNLMRLRVEYLAKNNYLYSSDEFVSKSGANFKAIQNVLYMLLKYKCNQDEGTLWRAIEKIKAVNDVERGYIPNLIDELIVYRK